MNIDYSTSAFLQTSNANILEVNTGQKATSLCSWTPRIERIYISKLLNHGTLYKRAKHALSSHDGHILHEARSSHVHGPRPCSPYAIGALMAHNFVSFSRDRPFLFWRFGTSRVYFSRVHVPELVLKWSRKVFAGAIRPNVAMRDLCLFGKLLELFAPLARRR